MYNGAAAESEIRGIVDQSANAGFGYDLVRHNLVVFRSGQGAMQVFQILERSSFHTNISIFCRFFQV